jgi:hypothetical protein
MQKFWLWKSYRTTYISVRLRRSANGSESGSGKVQRCKLLPDAPARDRSTSVEVAEPLEPFGIHKHGGQRLLTGTIQKHIEAQSKR